MLEKIIDVVKIALEKYLIPAIGAIAVAILLQYFTPDNFDLYIRLGERTYSLLLFCIAFLAIMFLKQVFKGISEKIYKRRINRKFKGKNAEKLFSRISPAAISVLIEMYNSPTHSKLLPYGGSIATMLRSYMFITCGQLSVEGEYFEYFLQPWVVEYLNKNIEKYR